MQNLVETPD